MYPDNDDQLEARSRHRSFKKKGGLRRVGDLPEEKKDGWHAMKEVCRHPEHNPPGHIVLQPGVYEYTCPGCGRTQTIIKRRDAIFGKRIW